MKHSKELIFDILTLLIVATISFSFQPIKPLRKVPNHSFTVGEKLEYRLHYGFVNAGEASIEVEPQYFIVNQRICYKINVIGKSTGSFDFFMRIRDQFISYVDTSAMLPHKFYRIIREGKYKLDETIHFDQQNGISKMKHNSDPETQHTVPKEVHDLVSGYYYLRTVNFEKQKVGDTTQINAFFDGQDYQFRVKYMGKDVIDTKFGRIRSIKLSPIMPDNEMFKGGNSISFWVSDDKNRVPLKVEAVMFVGSVDLDLKGYSGLKWPLAIEK